MDKQLQRDLETPKNVSAFPRDEHRRSSEGYGLEAVPPTGRLHWLRPTLIYAGCMVSFPVIYVGAMLSQLYSFWKSILAIVVAASAILVLDWINSALGADIGRPASVISRSAFGMVGSRLLVSSILVFVCLGWFGIQIEITSHLFLFAIGFNPSDVYYPIIFSLSTAILGLLFALPAVIGTKLFPWINYFSIPIILFVCLGGVGLAFVRQSGPITIFSFIFSQPDTGVSLSLGVTALIGVAAAQFLMLSDYSRYTRKLYPDSLYIPLIGILPAGLLLFLTGIFLSINTKTWDVVQILVLNLHMPLWVIWVLIFAQGSTVLVGAYSAGLALANMFNITHATSRSWITTLAVFIGMGLAMLDLLRHLESFLFIVALVCPVLGIVLAIDHFIFRNRLWRPKKGINWIALCATIGGCVLGALIPCGYPTFIAIFSATLIYWVGMIIASNIRSWPFIPENLGANRRNSFKNRPFLFYLVLGSGITAIFPIFLVTPWAEISTLFGCLLIGLGFFFQIQKEKGLAVEIESEKIKASRCD
ncbi:MAG: cytosine permease [Nitrososphaerota archaeon]